MGCDSDLEFMLGPGIRNNLPVVHPTEEWPVGCDGAEVVVCLVQESVPIVWAEYDFFAATFRVPCKFVTLVWIQILNMIFDCVMVISLIYPLYLLLFYIS